MNINLSDEMIQTLIAACETALEDYEARLPYVNSAVATASKDTTKLREARFYKATRNRTILQERIQSTKDALEMFESMMEGVK